MLIANVNLAVERKNTHHVAKVGRLELFAFGQGEVGSEAGFGVGPIFGVVFGILFVCSQAGGIIVVFPATLPHSRDLLDVPHGLCC